MKFLNLYIDESGNANPKGSKSKVFILSGCVVDKRSKDILKVKADQIKFKYWDKTNIIFHSSEIGRKEGDFKILKDLKKRESFERDLFNSLNIGSYYSFFIVVDLREAKVKNWNEDKVYLETSKLMVRNFVLSLLAIDKCRGKIIIESSTSKRDFYFHKAVNYFLSAGINELNVDYKKVKKVLTEISFVTKNNLDIEEQIADILAYGAKLKFLKYKGRIKYDKNILKTVKRKLFKINPNTCKRKKKYYSEIDSFKILP